MKNILWKNTTQKLFTIINTVILASIIISISTIIYTSNLKFDFSSIGYNNLFDIFKLPSYLLGSLLAIFSLQIVIYKIYQADERIDIATKTIIITKSNIKLNNYFMFKEEFVKDMLSRPPMSTKLNSMLIGMKINNLNILFKFYFGYDFNSFTGDIITKYKLKMIKFLEFIVNSPLNIKGVNLFEISNSDLEGTIEMLKKIEPIVFKNVLKYYDQILIPDEIERIRLKLIVSVKTTCEFYFNLFMFVGITYDKNIYPSNFIEEFDIFENELKKINFDYKGRILPKD